MLRKETNRIIFHHSLSDFGNVEEISKWHALRKPPIIPLGYHFVILKDGTIERGRELNQVGAHCRGRNRDSIGVCFIGDFRRYEPSREQIQAAYNLYSELHFIYQKRLLIEFHRDKENPCPGPMLNRDDFIEILKRVDL